MLEMIPTGERRHRKESAYGSLDPRMSLGVTSEERTAIAHTKVESPLTQQLPKADCGGDLVARGA